ncbi:MAG: hypothetical protein OHK0022_27810 [Roseiflexaceae bacterium]
MIAIEPPAAPKGRSSWTAVAAVLGELLILARTMAEQQRQIREDQRQIAAALAQLREERRA